MVLFPRAGNISSLLSFESYGLTLPFEEISNTTAILFAQPVPYVNNPPAVRTYVPVTHMSFW